MRHERLRANGLGGAFSILLLGLGVTTALQLPLNHSEVEEIEWDLTSEGYSIAVRAYGLLSGRLLILYLAHRRDAAYVTLVPAVTGALTLLQPLNNVLHASTASFRHLNAAMFDPFLSAKIKLTKSSPLTPHSMALVANMTDNVNALKGGVVSTA